MNFEQRHKKLLESIEELSNLNIKNETQLEAVDKSMEEYEQKMRERGVTPATIADEKQKLHDEIETETNRLEVAVTEIKGQVM